MKPLIWTLLTFVTVACGAQSQNSSESLHALKKEPKYEVDVERETRLETIKRAKVWMQPEVPISAVNFLEGEVSPGFIRSDARISCKWEYEIPIGGVTPKFLCKTNSGEVLKVKYAQGKKNNLEEIPAEIVSSRLLRALGFGADYMYTARRIRCMGCPKDPWSHTVHLHSPFEKVRRQFIYTYGRPNRNYIWEYEPDFRRFTDFTYVSVERRFGEHSIEIDGGEGWKWKELNQISSSHGGATRAEIDALILMAAFLNHTDNKKAQQRLVCLTPVQRNGYCDQPMMMIQDLGSTLGGKMTGLLRHQDKFNVKRWRALSVWDNSKTCRIDVDKHLNGSIDEVEISEEGRLLAAHLLSQLTDQQIYDLFKGARTADFARAPNNSIERWVEAFKHKRAMIVDREPCPK